MNLKEILKGKIDDSDLEHIPRAFDIIGDIAVIEIPDEFQKYEKLIAEAIMEMHKKVETVAKRSSITSGIERVRKIEVIAGEEKTETVHKENGLRLVVDLNKVFFSPRLSNERLRVESQIENGETVVDMFAGIGPFSILIAKRHKDTKVHAIDINKYAVDYMKRNMVLNKIGNVNPVLGDAKTVTKNLGKVADRIIMNLPRSSLDFIDSIPSIAKDGATVHLYCLLKDEEVDDKICLIKEKLGNVKIRKKVVCAEFGPGLNIYCIDFIYSS